MEGVPVSEPKTRYAHPIALNVATMLTAALEPFCERIVVVGSLRRMKPTVGDVEILFIPRFERRKADMFMDEDVNLAEEAIARLLSAGILGLRVSKTGHTSWGVKNKLAVHTASGIPVDLFTASPENWWNYLVCRTGPGESNIQICQAAQAKGWKWEPYNSGFSRVLPQVGGGPNTHVVTSEEDVFNFVGLPYLPPEKRGLARA